MKRLDRTVILAAAVFSAALLVSVIFPLAQQGWRDDIGTFANDAAADAHIVALGWDDTGSCREGMFYRNSTDDTIRLCEAGSWVESDANTTIASNSTTHIADSANPHTTDLGNLGTGTLAELNTLVAPSVLDTTADPRDPNAHASTHDIGGGDEMSDLSGVITVDGGPTTLSDIAAAITDPVDSLTFNSTAQAHAEGMIYYDSTAKTHVSYIDFADVSMNLGQETWARVTNNTGVQIDNGEAVSLIGGGEAELTDASDTSTNWHFPLAIATMDIPDTQEGVVTFRGLVNDLNTMAWAPGTELFVDPATPGALTPTEPMAPDRVVHAGTVEIQNALTGSVRAWSHYHLDSREISLMGIGTPTYGDMQDFVRTAGSAGLVTGGGITDAGGATIDVAAGAGWIRDAASSTSELYTFDWSASSGIAIPANAVRYVGIEYNAGSPQVVVSATEDWSGTDEFQLGAVANEGGTLHIAEAPQLLADFMGATFQRLYDTEPLPRDERAGGLIIGETGTREVTMSAGTLWEGLNSYSLSAIDTSGADDFTYYWLGDGVGAWNSSAGETQLDNLHYDDGTDVLGTLGNNKFVNLWTYIGLEGDMALIYGQTEHSSLAHALDEGAPATTPPAIQAHGRLIGRYTIEKSAGSADSIQSVFEVAFVGAGVTDHGSLAGLGDVADHAGWTDLSATSWMLDEDDMASDSATKVASQQSIKAYVDDNGGDSFIWTADLSGTYDWKANGHESTDPTSGFEVYSPTDLGDFTTLSVGGGVITIDVSASGADKYAYLIVPLTDLPDLAAASSIYMRVDLDLDDAASNFDTQNDTLAFYLTNLDDPAGAYTEYSMMRFVRDGSGNIEIMNSRRVNNADGNSTYVDVTNPKNAGWMQMVDQAGNQIAQFYEGTGHNITQTGGLTQTTLHARSGSSHCWIWMRAKNGGRVAATISSIKIVIE